MTQELDDRARTRSLMDKVAESPRALVNLTRTLLIPRGEHDLAHEALERALAAAPDDPELVAAVTRITGGLAASWYFTMVQDAARHALYEEALRRVIRPDSIVLDIGAGTGLFAMIAARAGAALVIGCERDPHVARAAQRVVDANGFADRIRIVARDSKDLIVGVDLPRRADVLLWDNLSNNLIGAGALKTVKDARRRLIREDAAIVPQGAEIRAALVQDDKPERRAMTSAAGFDLTPFNRLRASNVTVGDNDTIRRSDPVTVCTFDVAAPGETYPGRCKVEMVSTGGVIDGVVQWLRFRLHDEIVYDNSAAGSSAFGHQLHAVPTRMSVAGDALTLGYDNDGQSNWFWIDPAPSSS